jgi:GNAT superfamily N-acetyltransferase
MTELTFLDTNPTVERLQRAILENTRWWMMRCARGAGGEAHSLPGVTWAHTPAPQGDTEVVFSGMTRAQADAQLDGVVAEIRRREPVKSVLCWSLDPPRPRDLEARLLARGFEWCWQPRWMSLELARMREDHPRPPGLRVEMVADEGLWEVEELPYYSPSSARSRYGASRRRPRRVWRFAAWLDGQVVGHSSLNLTTGPLGVAGIYDVGVLGAARNQGVGKAVVLAACQHARSLGCRHALLNGTGERMYQQIGFENIGFGLTWFMPAATLAAPAPSPARVRFAEAVGRDEVARLAALAADLSPSELDAPLPSGYTPLHLAAGLGRLEAARWLVEHGADTEARTRHGQTAYALAAESGHADLAGWLLQQSGPATRFLAACERGDAATANSITAAHPNLARSLRPEDQQRLVAAAGAGQPEAVRLMLDAGIDIATRGDWGGTALHHAGWNGHAEVVALLLERGAPLELTNDFGGTPLGTTTYGSLHCRNPKGDYAAVAERLIAAGAKLPAQALGTEPVLVVLRRHGVGG